MKAEMSEMVGKQPASTIQAPEFAAQDRLNSVETKTAAQNHSLQTQLRKKLGEFVLEVAFQSRPGFTILFGASGAGKTTLLDCIGGSLSPDDGHIQLGERILYDSGSRTNVPLAKRRVGYVFQGLALFPHLSVEQNIAYGLSKLSRADRATRVCSILREFHIEHLAARLPDDISGGESQRVALARTLVTNPTVLLLDEPLSALDAPTKSKIIHDLREWNRTHRIPILYVTHSREEVFALGERVIVLDRGKILAQGTPHEVMAAPIEETVAQLAGFENIFDATVEAVHPEQGSMTCRIGVANSVFVETPLVRAGVGTTLRIGIRAGDILLATALPHGLSARNVIPGQVRSLEQRDVIVSSFVECGTAAHGERTDSGLQMEVHLTLAARDSLRLEAGRQVWLVIKTHSCHLMRAG
jgi:molybdate transport system ATP-binding protein